MLCLVVLVVAVGVLLPMLSQPICNTRSMQYGTQLRGIQQAMWTFAQSNRSGGGDGWYPGLDADGRTLPVGKAIPAAQLGAAADVPGYAAEPVDHVPPGEMNTTAARGFLTRSMAELVAGDFLPAGGAAYLLSPVDPVKRSFVADGSSVFTTANISHVPLDLSRGDGGAWPLTAGWTETANPGAVLLADRAVGDGSDATSRSSVWTEPGSGDWHGSVVRNDGSVGYVESAAATSLSFGDSGSRVEAPVIDNLFSDTFRLEADAAGGTRVSADSGLLYDEADSGTDPDAF